MIKTLHVCVKRAHAPQNNLQSTECVLTCKLNINSFKPFKRCKDEI